MNKDVKKQVWHDLLRIPVIAAFIAAFPAVGLPASLYLIIRHMYREVQKVDEESPQDVQKRVLALPNNDEARALLKDLETIRTNVFHAMNAIEG